MVEEPLKHTKRFFNDCLLSEAGFFIARIISLKTKDHDDNRKPQPKRIAVVAHENKKTELIEWAYLNKKVLSQHQLIATGNTGKILEGTLDVPVKHLLHGRLGGDQQLGAMITDGKLDAIVFFWNPAADQPRHDTDINALIKIAVSSDILITSNRTVADFV